MVSNLDPNFNNGTIKYINDLSVNIIDFKCHLGMIYSVANDTTNNKITLIKQNNSGDIIDHSSYDISANNNINAISLKIHNNSIFVLGNLSNNNYSTFFLSSFNLDLSKNNYFNNGIKIYDNNDTNYSSLVSSDFAFNNNDIFVSGFVNNNDFLIVKFNSNGTLDTTFGLNGNVIHDISGQSIDKSNSILINNNSIFLGGHTKISTDKIYYTISKYNIDGILDTTFGSNGFVLTDLNNYYGDIITERTLTKLVIQDNKIIAFGSAIRLDDIDPTTYSVTTYFNNVLIRYNYDDGSLDTTFGTFDTFGKKNGILTIFLDNNLYLNDIAIDKNNKIIVSGFIEDNNNYKLLVKRFNENGEYDIAFSNNGTASYDLTINTVNLNLLNLKIDIDNNDRIIVCGNYNTNENIIAAIIGYLYNNVNVCFPRDTPVVTDQGEIMIQNINKTNTLNGKKVVAVTESVPLDENIVVIEKDALFKNMPSQKTKISQNHRLLFKGEMVKASELVNKVEGAYYEKYNKEILYNVLLDTHEKMIVNNLICETLDPENMVALLYKNRAKMSNKKYSRLVGKINKTVKDRDMLSFIKIGKRLLAM